VELNFQTLAALWVIILAFSLGASAVINLRAADPRARGMQLASLVVLLALATAAYAVSGYWAAAIIVALGVTAEVVHLVVRRTKRRAA